MAQSTNKHLLHLTRSAVKRILKSINELEFRAIESPVENWKHWNFEVGRSQCLAKISSIRSLLYEAESLLNTKKVNDSQNQFNEILVNAKNRTPEQARQSMIIAGLLEESGELAEKYK